MKTVLATLALGLVAACGGDPVPTPDPSIPAPTAMPTQVPAVDGEVTATTIVMDTGDGPELCLGGIAESYPPQCGGPPIKNWDWSAVEHEDFQGKRWGDYTVIGTFDGEMFTLKRFGKPPAPPDHDMDFTSPCKPKPAWVDRGLADKEAAMSAANRLPDLGGIWADGPILNVKVTEDLKRAERTVRQHWGGPLCVSKAKRTEKGLRKIQIQLFRKLPGAQSGGTNIITEQVEIDVIADDGSIQAWVDAEYGEDVVKVTSALRPVD